MRDAVNWVSNSSLSQNISARFPSQFTNIQLHQSCIFSSFSRTSFLFASASLECLPDGRRNVAPCMMSRYISWLAARYWPPATLAARSWPPATLAARSWPPAVPEMIKHGMMYHIHINSNYAYYLISYLYLMIYSRSGICKKDKKQGLIC